MVLQGADSGEIDEARRLLEEPASAITSPTTCMCARPAARPLLRTFHAVVCAGRAGDPASGFCLAHEQVARSRSESRRTGRQAPGWLPLARRSADVEPRRSAVEIEQEGASGRGWSTARPSVPLIVPCVSALLLQRAGANNPRVIAIAAPSEKGSVLAGRPARSVEPCQPGVGGRNFFALADVKRRARSFTGDGDRGVSAPRFVRRSRVWTGSAAGFRILRREGGRVVL
jgi:hypothetical protein